MYCLFKYEKKFLYAYFFYNLLFNMVASSLISDKL